MKWFKNLFKDNKQTEIIIHNDSNIEAVENDIYEWKELSKEKPPHEVVLIAWYTYDCGWIMRTGWWYIDKNCWMSSGGKSKKIHDNYTHWRKLPPDPDGF